MSRYDSLRHTQSQGGAFFGQSGFSTSSRGMEKGRQIARQITRILAAQCDYRVLRPRTHANLELSLRWRTADSAREQGVQSMFDL